VGGRVYEGWVGRSSGCGGCGLRVSRRASEGAARSEGSGVPALVEVAGTARSVVGNRLGLGGIELGASFSNGVLEALQQLVVEGGGIVETEAAFRMRRILSRVTFGLLEEPVHDAQVVVVVRTEGGAEAMEEAHGPERGAGLGAGTGRPQSGPESPEQDMEDGASGAGTAMEEGPKTFRHGEDELAHRYVGDDVVHQVSRGLGHALGMGRRLLPVRPI